MPTIKRETMGAVAKFEVWEENFFLGASPSYTEAEKIQEEFLICKNEFLRNYLQGMVPAGYKLRENE
jgi:hypothetical protein